MIEAEEVVVAEERKTGTKYGIAEKQARKMQIHLHREFPPQELLQHRLMYGLSLPQQGNQGSGGKEWVRGQGWEAGRPLRKLWKHHDFSEQGIWQWKLKDERFDGVKQNEFGDQVQVLICNHSVGEILKS